MRQRESTITMNHDNSIVYYYRATPSIGKNKGPGSVIFARNDGLLGCISDTQEPGGGRTSRLTDLGF